MSIAQRSVRSAGFNISASVIQTIVLALRSIFLARLLTPTDFGGYTFVSSIILLTSSIPNFGMGAAYIHKAKESEGEDALRVYFTLSVLFNSIWAVFMLITARLFVEQKYLWMFWIILITQVIDNIARVGQVKLMKGVDFKRIALVDIAVVLGTTLTAIYLAWKGFHIWSLVSTDVVASLIVVLGFYTFRPIWKPSFYWSNRIVKYFVDFGKRTFIAGLLGQALDRVDDLWTGFFLGDVALGYYSRAYTFATYPRKILATPLNNVAGSTYAELKYEPKKLSQAFFRVNSFLIRTGFLLAGLLALIAPEFIQLVVGEKWLPMMTAFRLMLIYTLLDPIKGTVASLFVAVGRPELVVRARGIQFIVLIIGLLVFGSIWGISGVAFAVNTMLFVGIVVLLWQARDYVKFSTKRMFLVPMFALVTGIALTLLVIVFFEEIQSVWVTGSIKIVVFSTVYIVTIFIFERKDLIILLNWFKGFRAKFT